MKLAYIDTSVLVAIAYGEEGHKEIASRLSDLDRAFASNIVEAELHALLSAEGHKKETGRLTRCLTWVYPHRPLSQEYARILAAGKAAGTALWHLACALYLQEEVGELAFLSADTQQAELATRLGLA